MGDKLVVAFLLSIPEILPQWEGRCRLKLAHNQRFTSAAYPAKTAVRRASYGLTAIRRQYHTKLRKIADDTLKQSEYRRPLSIFTEETKQICSLEFLRM